jgi:hypothetical protein
MGDFFCVGVLCVGLLLHFGHIAQDFRLIATPSENRIQPLPESQIPKQNPRSNGEQADAGDVQDESAQSIPIRENQ